MPPINVEAVALRSGTSADWAATSLVLGLGELGAETDTGVLKLGDGVTGWADLPPSGGGGSADLTPTYLVAATTELSESSTPVLLAGSSDFTLRTDQFTLTGGDTLTCIDAGDYRVEVYLDAGLGGSGFGEAGLLEIEAFISVNEENAGPAWNYYPRSSNDVEGIDQRLTPVTFSFPQTFAEGDDLQLMSRYVLPSVGGADMGTATVTVGDAHAAVMLTKLN